MSEHYDGGKSSCRLYRTDVIILTYFSNITAYIILCRSSQLEWSCVKCGEPDIFEEDCFLTSLLKKAITNPDSEDEAEDQNNTERRQLEVIKVESPDAFWIKFLSFSER